MDTNATELRPLRCPYCGGEIGAADSGYEIIEIDCDNRACAAGWDARGGVIRPPRPPLDPAVPDEPRIADGDLLREATYDPEQLVNEGPRGIRLTHRPTGLSVTRTDHRSQLQNTAAALADLRALIVLTTAPEVHPDGGV